MVDEADPQERWRFGNRCYLVTLASSPETVDLELDDVGPSLGRGPTLYASRADDSGAITVSVLTDDWLPIELFESFLAEARGRVVPRSGTGGPSYRAGCLGRLARETAAG